jgi:hypothetical protein
MGKASRRKQLRRNESEDVVSFWAQEYEPPKAERKWFGLPPLARIEANLPQEQKISHALVELLKEEVPYDDAPLSEYKNALDGIVIAWNLSLLASDDRTNAVGKMFKDVTEANREIALQEIERLMQRKQALFPEDKRQVLAWSVRMEGSHIRVQAGAKA